MDEDEEEEQEVVKIFLIPIFSSLIMTWVQNVYYSLIMNIMGESRHLHQHRHNNHGTWTDEYFSFP